MVLLGDGGLCTGMFRGWASLQAPSLVLILLLFHVDAINYAGSISDPSTKC